MDEKSLEEISKQKNNIIARLNVFCPVCLEKQFSAFDKLYTVAYNCCYSCTTVRVCDEQSDVIFNMLLG